MAWKSSSRGVFFLVYLALLLTQLTIAKSSYPISDTEIKLKKDNCYADIESGLWGWQCKKSVIAKENCVLQCLSPRCYELIYESDPLEEGEKDLIRSQEYKYCMQSAGDGSDDRSGDFLGRVFRHPSDADEIVIPTRSYTRS